MAANPPAGWYPDPERPGRQRFWDGSAWTQAALKVPHPDDYRPQTFIDASFQTVGLLGGKKRRLVVTSEGLSWGEEHLRWDEVKSARQLITVSPIEIIYEMSLECGDRVVRISWTGKRKHDAAPKQAYELIIRLLRRIVAPRVYGSLHELMVLGKPIRVAGLLLSPEGVAHEAKRDEMIPWSDYSTAVVDGATTHFINIFRRKDGGKTKRACRVEVDMLNAWVIPPLIQEHARRYAPRR